ncbi:MAG: hypothetical protein H7062_17560 [Candidatus Saccharimonas sp.]|nr:hypothetical protein [Planctomycetaceae bacterium]
MELGVPTVGRRGPGPAERANPPRGPRERDRRTSGQRLITINASITINPAIFEESEIGFLNGLKTGLKALVNETANTGAGLISLGQWDPPHLWKVQPNDLYYDQASIAANGVNLKNGLQVVGGVLGGAQLNGAAKAAQAEQAAGEAIASQSPAAMGISNKVSAKMDVHPDLPARSGQRTNGVLTDMENTISEKVVSGGPAPAAFDSRWSQLSVEAKRAALHVEGKAVARSSSATRIRCRTSSSSCRASCG